MLNYMLQYKQKTYAFMQKVLNVMNSLITYDDYYKTNQNVINVTKCKEEIEKRTKEIPRGEDDPIDRSSYKLYNNFSNIDPKIENKNILNYFGYHGPSYKVLGEKIGKIKIPSHPYVYATILYNDDNAQTEEFFGAEIENKNKEDFKTELHKIYGNRCVSVSEIYHPIEKIIYQYEGEEYYGTDKIIPLQERFSLQNKIKIIIGGTK